MLINNFYTPIPDKETLSKVSLILSFLGHNVKNISRGSRSSTAYPIALYCLESSSVDFLEDRKSIDISNPNYNVFKNRNMQLITVEEIFNM